MKYIKSFNESFDRVVGFRYSEPKESYKVSILCIGEEITEDKINRGLKNTSDLKFEPESTKVTILSEEESLVETPDGAINIDAIVEFNVIIYTEREIRGIVEELQDILSSAFDIQVLNWKSKRNLEI